MAWNLNIPDGATARKRLTTFVRSLTASIVWAALAAIVLFCLGWATTRFIPGFDSWWTADMQRATYLLLFFIALATRRILEVLGRRRQKSAIDNVGWWLQIANARTLLALVIGVGLLFFGSQELPQDSLSVQVAEHKALVRILSKEIGFAFIVAIVIWTMFELFKREEEEDLFNSRLEQIKRSVFFSVFKRNFPDELMDEADQLLLGKSFVRPTIDLLYTLTESECPRDGVAGTVPIVLLSSVAKYRVKNVGNEVLACPNRAALPNPLHPEMKALVQVKKVHYRVGDEKPVEVDLKEAEKKFRRQLEDNSIHDVRFELPDIDVGGDKELEIVWEYTMVKEEEDTEVMRFLFPTGRLDLTIIDRTKTPRLIRARAIHRKDLIIVAEERENGVYKYSLENYFLPQQGYMIWWKKDVPASKFTAKESALRVRED